MEFADFQCPHCKEAQANMDKLVADFPKARIVFQNYPLPQHSRRPARRPHGVCVAKEGGSTAFFTFASAVFDGQDGLATPDGATLTLNSAVTKAGLDPAKIAACADEPADQGGGGSLGEAGQGPGDQPDADAGDQWAVRVSQCAVRDAEADHGVPGEAGRSGAEVGKLESTKTARLRRSPWMGRAAGGRFVLGRDFGVPRIR